MGKTLMDTLLGTLVHGEEVLEDIRVLRKVSLDKIKQGNEADERIAPLHAKTLNLIVSAIADTGKNAKVIRLSGADISARDNISLAMAASNLSPVLQTARDRGLIDDAELLRLLYRFCGESVDVEEMLARGKAAPPAPAMATPASKAQPVKIDPETGEEKGASDA